MTGEPIRTDTSPVTMVRAIEDNVLAYWRLLAESGVIYFERQDDIVTYGPSTRPSPFFDGVLWTGFGDGDADRRIDETLAGFGCPGKPVIWLTLPSSTPHDIGDRLVRRGLALRTDLPSMAVATDDVQWQEMPPGVGVEAVRSLGRLKIMNDVAAEAFGMPPGLEDVFYRAYRGLGLGDPRWRGYLGLVDDEPAGSTVLVLGDGVAGIYHVAVSEVARRRGLGTALTLKALADAREAGYRIVTLRASEMGEPMYRRLGFEEHCRIAQYWWVPHAVEG